MTATAAQSRDRIRRLGGCAAVVVRARPATPRAEPAILQPAEPFLDLSGEDIRKSLYLTSDPSGEELCLRPGPDHSGGARLSRLSRGRQAGGFSYLGPVFRYRQGRPANSCRPASNHSAARTAPPPMPKCWRSASRRPRPSASATSISAPVTSRCCALIDGARPLSGLEAPADQGLQPQDQPAQDLERLTARGSRCAAEYEGVLAALAGSDRKARWRWSPT
jgi:ATP phosphoribosyltransferase regulatory subunit